MSSAIRHAVRLRVGKCSGPTEDQQRHGTKDRTQEPPLVRLERSTGSRGWHVVESELPLVMAGAFLFCPFVINLAS